jgi:hypothetical protein
VAAAVEDKVLSFPFYLLQYRKEEMFPLSSIDCGHGCVVNEVLIYNILMKAVTT